MPDVNNVSKIIPPKVVEKVYEDGLSAPTREAGAIATDVLKAARLLLAPIQMLGAWQERFERFVKTVAERVPEERRTEAPASVAGPVIEKLKYVEVDNPLQDLYLNLLARAIDKERQDEAHPAFPTIIEQLSQDEAMLLGVMSDMPLEIECFNPGDMYSDGSDIAPVILVSDRTNVPDGLLTHPKRFDVYLSHLEHLHLVDHEIYKKRIQHEPEPGSWTTYAAIPTEFGSMFIKACIPEDWYEQFCARRSSRPSR